MLSHNHVFLKWTFHNQKSLVCSKHFQKRHWVFQGCYLNLIKASTIWAPINQGSRGRCWGGISGTSGHQLLSYFLVCMIHTWITYAICWDSWEKHVLKTAEIMKINMYHGIPIQPSRNQARSKRIPIVGNKSLITKRSLR